ncbi:response regulator [Deinococcus yavapaiensis]|uniref:Hpt domain-containing protein n=1 Tax=Deinococcus yavapaiensis KR-236 TaxID=694435 RepID=A0A318S5U2_9DEIO|nr:response regulator [Deinococcus yavapaiensis]PYE49909.1 Hpt domain-containing protein [Deinococcus yavapaiensis KR-236]
MIDAPSRILLAEDDPDIQAIAQIALEDVGGFQVHLCASGAEALAQFADFAPDLVMLDVMMPGMTGPDTLKALRELPGGRDVPVVFMTARVQASEVQAYLDLGAIGVIPKPFEPMTLAEDVRALLHDHSANTEAREDDEFEALVRAQGEQFRQQLPERLARIRTVFERVRRGETEPRALSLEAHALSGTSGTLQFTRIAEIAARIERDPSLADATLHGQDVARLDALVAELEAAIGEAAR